MSRDSLRITFVRLLMDQLGTVLASHGFTGEASDFKQVKGETINCLWIQNRSDDKACCVNLGVDFGFLREDSSKLRQADCEIKKRMTPNAELDYWWGYNTEQTGVSEIIGLFTTKGLSFFSQFDPFPGKLTDLTIRDLEGDSYLSLLSGMTRGRAGLLLARVHEKLEDTEAAIQFAEFGLQHLNSMAVGPRKILKELIAKHQVK